MKAFFVLIRGAAAGIVLASMIYVIRFLFDVVVGAAKLAVNGYKAWKAKKVEKVQKTGPRAAQAA